MPSVGGSFLSGLAISTVAVILLCLPACLVGAHLAHLHLGP